MKKYVKKMIANSNLTFRYVAEKLGIPFDTLNSRQRRNAYSAKDFLKIAKITNSKLYIIYSTGEEEELKLNECSDE